MNKEVKRLAHEIDDFVASSLYPGGTNDVIDARYGLWDYGGTQPPDSNCAFILTLQPKDGSNGNQQHEEYWNVGPSSKFVPDPENNGWMIGSEPPSRSCNYFQLTNSLNLNCGLEKGKLSTDVGVKILIGSEITFTRVDPPARDFRDDSNVLDPTTGQPRTQQQRSKPKQILVATKATWAWEKGNKKTTGMTNAKPTTQAATTANGDNGDLLTTSIVAILTESDGAIELTNLMPKITEKLSVVAGLSAGKRISILKTIKASDGKSVDPVKLGELSNLWSVDSGEGIVVLV